MAHLRPDDSRSMPSARSLTRLWVPEACIQLMKTEAATHAPQAESGGIIVGYWAGEAEGVVTDITTPGPAAVRDRERFVPDYGYDESFIERAWMESDGAETYLGDWHSHPHSNGVLSWKDRRTLGRIANDPAASAPKPIMLIVAMPSERWVLAGWRAKRAGIAWFAWTHLERIRITRFLAAST